MAEVKRKAEEALPWKKKKQDKKEEKNHTAVEPESKQISEAPSPPMPTESFAAIK